MKFFFLLCFLGSNFELAAAAPVFFVFFVLCLCISGIVFGLSGKNLKKIAGNLVPVIFMIRIDCRL